MILIYHHVAPAGADRPISEGWFYCISPENFERQLRELIRRGYRFVPLQALVAGIERNGRESAGVAAITLDDGWMDNFTYAFPILQRLGLPATFFVTTEHVCQGVEDPRRMNVAQLRSLIQAGMTIGGHSRTHPNLATLTTSRATDEIAGCKQDLETALGVPISFFAYPFGAHNPETVRIVHNSGYRAAFSAWGGARNTRSARYWLYRDSFSPGIDTVADRRAMSPLFRRIIAAKRGWRHRFVRMLWPIKMAYRSIHRGIV